MTFRRRIHALAAALLLLALLLPAACAAAETAPFRYENDPRENPTAMRDIVENPDAVYGFSPSRAEESTLKEYADLIDWTDPEQVAAGRQQRQEYHDSLQALYDIVLTMTHEGRDIETIARIVSERRNGIRMESYRDDPEGLETLKKRNLETYGNEYGPDPDQLYEKYGSWETVLLKALGSNCGMDACLGFYDDYFYVYDLAILEDTEEESEEDAAEEPEEDPEEDTAEEPEEDDGDGSAEAPEGDKAAGESRTESK